MCGLRTFDGVEAGVNTAQLLTLLAQHDGCCLIDPVSGERSYREVIRLAEENAHVLARLGLTADKGQSVVALDVRLGWRFVPLLLAAFMLQVTVVPLDQMQHTHARQIIQAVRPALIFDRSNVDSHGRLVSARLPLLDIRARDDLQDVALILYTSGTSGRPKGVMLTYRNIWSNAAAIQAYSQFRSHDTLLIVRPLTHASALTGELLPGLIAGSRICIKDPDASPLSALQQIERLGISVIGATPTLLARFAHFAGRMADHRLRLLIASGEMPLPGQIRRIRSAFPETALWHAYGLTEASPRVSCLTEPLNEQNYRCVGKLLPEVSARIVDRAGNPLPEGSEGELLVAGPNVMKGYYGDRQATAEKLRDGWLHTTDRASIAGGLLYIHGRADNMMIRAGLNIYPQEIEALLLSHPHVREALVFGTEGSAGQRIHAWVVTDGLISEKDLFAHLAQVAQPRLWPDVIEFKQRLAKTSSGKLVRP